MIADAGQPLEDSHRAQGNDDTASINSWHSCLDNDTEVVGQSTTNPLPATVGDGSTAVNCGLAADEQDGQPAGEPNADADGKVSPADVVINIPADQPSTETIGTGESFSNTSDTFWFFRNDCYSFALFATLNDPERDTGAFEAAPLPWKNKPSKCKPLFLCTLVVILQLVLMTLLAHAKGHAFENQAPLPGTEKVTRDILSKYGYAHQFNFSDSLYRRDVFDFIPAENNVALFSFMHFTSFLVAFLYTASDIYSGLHKAAFCIQMWHLSDNQRFWLFSRDAKVGRRTIAESDSRSTSGGGATKVRNMGFLYVALVLIPFQTFIALHITQWTLKSLFQEDSFSGVVVDLLVFLYICELDEKVMDFAWLFPRGSAEQMDISGTKIMIAYKPQVSTQHRTPRIFFEAWWSKDWVTNLVCFVATFYLPGIAYFFNICVGSGYIRFLLPKSNSEPEANTTDSTSIEYGPGYIWLLVWVPVFLVMVVPLYVFWHRFRKKEKLFKLPEYWSLSQWKPHMLPLLFLFAVTSKVVFRAILAFGLQDPTFTVAEILLALLSFPCFVYAVRDARAFQDYRRVILWACTILCFIFFERTLFAEYFYRIYEIIRNAPAPRPNKFRSF